MPTIIFRTRLDAFSTQMTCLPKRITCVDKHVCKLVQCDPYCQLDLLDFYRATSVPLPWGFFSTLHAISKYILHIKYSFSPIKQIASPSCYIRPLSTRGSTSAKHVTIITKPAAKIVFHSSRSGNATCPARPRHFFGSMCMCMCMCVM
jgi:hypothetical protein